MMTLVALSCLATVIVLIAHHRADQGKQVPSWLRKIFFNHVAPFLRVDTGDKNASCWPFKVRTFTVY